MKNSATHNLFSKSNQSSDKSTFDILYMLDEIKIYVKIIFYLGKCIELHKVITVKNDIL
jgi:hypothetical protein